MDPSYPDWSLESDLLPFTNQKKPSSTNDELMELIWQNGQVVMQSQTRGRPGLNHLGSQQLPKKSEANYHYQNTNGSYANSSTLIQDDETVSWINYPVDDPLEEFCSPFFTANLRSPCPIETVAGKPAKTMARQGPWASQFGGAGDVRECSGMTIGSSHCESNQVIQNESDFSRASSIGTNKMRSCYSQHFTEDNLQQVTHQETTVATSAGGSGSSLGGIDKSSAGACGLKRKGRDMEESECQSKAAKLESGSEKRPSQPSGSTRRRRTADVHNLSERRRRDRINKKMKALQELIPHCNKTDKASMLDDVIEYLKSLQLHLQVMCMGRGMAAQMMFPAMPPYMGMGLGSHQLAFNNIHQSMPMVLPNQNAMSQAPVFNPINFQTQVQTQSCLPQQLARYMGVHQLQQVAASQAMNTFSFIPQTLQNPQMNAASQGGSSMVQPSGVSSTHDASTGNTT